MCELLGLSSLMPTTVSITLERLARHGARGQPGLWRMEQVNAADPEKLAKSGVRIGRHRQ